MTLFSVVVDFADCPQCVLVSPSREAAVTRAVAECTKMLDTFPEAIFAPDDAEQFASDVVWSASAEVIFASGVDGLIGAIVQSHEVAF